MLCSCKANVSIDIYPPVPHTGSTMNLADKLTLSRIVLAPVFFALYSLPSVFPEWAQGNMVLIVVVLWLVFLFGEITDGLDGMAARKLKITSDFGRLFDPFADTLMQLTLLLCFVLEGIFPAILFLVVIYREFSILFLRNLMLKKGITMGARIGGKIKTVSYITACGLALAYSSLIRLDIIGSLHRPLEIASLVVFVLSVLVAVASFFDYLSVYRSSKEAGAESQSDKT